MKKIIIVATLIVLLILPATPVLAAALSEYTTPPVDMKEPVVVEMLPDSSSVPNPLWPGTTLKWKYRITNVSPQDYWLSGGLRWEIAEGEFWMKAPEVSLGSTKLNIWQPFIIPAGAVRMVTISATIKESSPIAKGVRFTPSIQRIDPPEDTGKG